MAEGWARHLKGDVIEAYSAGIEAHGLHPRAIRVMAEAGVDIACQVSKRVDDLLHLAFDYVLTVCGHANEHCPIFPGRAKVIHVGFDDPAKAKGSEAAIMDTFRSVRDDIKAFVETFPQRLQTGNQPDHRVLPTCGVERGQR
jgi:arsenate reductase